jgi:hypothetical protein
MSKVTPGRPDTADDARGPEDRQLKLRIRIATRNSDVAARVWITTGGQAAQRRAGWRGSQQRVTSSTGAHLSSCLVPARCLTSETHVRGILQRRAA